MTQKLERTRNTNDVATRGSVTATGTAQTLAAANPDRQGFHVNNGPAPEAAWVRLQLASEDTTSTQDIFLAEKGEGDTRWDMPPDNPYTGEISVIRENSNVIVNFVEW